MDKELIKDVFSALKRDKNRGLELLYNNYHTVLLGVAYKYTQSKELSEDAVQDVYLKLLNLDASYFPKKSELSWLYVVTKNEALSYIRKESKYSLIDKTELIKDEDYIKHTEMSFEDMVDSLNENQKEVVSLKLYSGLTHSEISKLLNKPIGTVQWIYNSSIKRLRKTLLSTLIISAVLLISGTSRYAFLYYDLHYGNNGSNPNIDLRAYYTDTLGIVLLSVFLVVFIVSIIIYKKSDKIPTKYLFKSSK